MDTAKTIQTVVAGIAHTAYGIGIKGQSEFTSSPFDYDSYDLWFGQDFDFFLENLLDDLLDEIETDISSVDSSNISEQHSAQQSAQSSADRKAMQDAGLQSLDSTSTTTGNSVSRISSMDSSLKVTGVAGVSSESGVMPVAGVSTVLSNSAPSVSSSSTSSDASTDSHEHAHHGLQWGNDSDAESDYSGDSWSDEGDYTGLSDSEGTSQATGEASTLSTVSIELKEYDNYYKNDNDDAFYELLTAEDFDDAGDYEAGVTGAATDFNGIAGIAWQGDADNEKMFGSSWMDELFGGAGNDDLHGLEGDDYITGGQGRDKIWADAGNDIIYTGYGKDEVDSSDDSLDDSGSVDLMDGDFASGGSGDDKIYGSATLGVKENLFGGTGNDIIKSYDGDDRVYGGPGHDTIEVGEGDNYVEGGDGNDNILTTLRTVTGDNNIDGGKGDDRIFVGAGEDDVYGSDGDDVILGGAGDDDLWGGDGDDYILGGADADVIRGGDGDDVLIPGTDFAGAGGAPTEYVYGDAGDDAIFGSTTTVNEYLLGGAGSDYIRGGNTGAESDIFGGDGDDFIRRGDGITVSSTVNAGKGDDTVGQVIWNDLNSTFERQSQYTLAATPDYTLIRHPNKVGVPNLAADPTGLTAFTGEPFGIVAANYGDDSITGTEVVHGEQGDDEIWGGAKTSDTQHLHGGSGDDSVYVGYKAAGKAYAYGNSGKDIVRSDWFSQYDEDIFAAGNEYLFGDFKYGTDNLDKDLWGDDDIIYGGNDEGSYNGYRYGGDGDDIIWTGDGWKESKSYGGNDDDTFHLGQLNTAIKTYGGDGDDTWVRTQDYGEVTDETSANTGVEYARGGAGNDVVRGTHLNTGNQFLFGGDGEDMLYGGDGVAAYGRISGGDGDDWIQGGDNAAGNQYLHGDSTDFTNEWGFTTEVTGETNYGEGNDRFQFTDRGNDVIYGGDEFVGSQYLFGGYGDDKLIGGQGLVTAAETQTIYGDHGMGAFPGDTQQGKDIAADTGRGLKFRGLPEDGDDLIDLGDTAGAAYSYGFAFGQGGNDKIFGGLMNSYGYQYLYGGDGDDKIWTLNPGQIQDLTVNDQQNFLRGGDGNDIVYGNQSIDFLYGDFKLGGTFEAEGGDDIIYTGEGELSTDGSWAFGGVGDDKLYGQGQGADFLIGGWDDDKIWGGDGDDHLFGDDASALVAGTAFIPSSIDATVAQNIWDSANQFYKEYGIESGDDTIYGGEGKDHINGGAGHDYLHGGVGQDTIFGSAGEDTIWGDEGSDLIYTGTGWDTVFGGPGCDYIYSEDGGDVIWGGDCDPAATIAAITSTPPTETPNNAANAMGGPYQMFFIVGTGPDPENYTVVMDFWHETAMPHNILCLYPDRAQGVPGSGACTVEQNFAADTTAALTAQSSCLTAVDIMSGRAPLADMHDPKRTRNSGCKNDGGPLWISVELADEETGVAGANGDGDVPRSVFGKIFQKKQKFTSRRRSRRSSRYSQVGSYPTETKSDLVECMALQLCTATAAT